MGSANQGPQSRFASPSITKFSEGTRVHPEVPQTHPPRVRGLEALLDLVQGLVGRPQASRPRIELNPERQKPFGCGGSTYMNALMGSVPQKLVGFAPPPPPKKKVGSCGLPSTQTDTQRPEAVIPIGQGSRAQCTGDGRLCVCVDVPPCAKQPFESKACSHSLSGICRRIGPDACLFP